MIKGIFTREEIIKVENKTIISQANFLKETKN